MTPIKVLLTGASGTVGFRVLLELLQKKSDFNITLLDYPAEV